MDSPEPSSAFPALAAKCAYNVTKYFINCAGRGYRARAAPNRREQSPCSRNGSAAGTLEAHARSKSNRRTGRLVCFKCCMSSPSRLLPSLWRPPCGDSPNQQFLAQGKTLSAAGSGFFSFDPTSRNKIGRGSRTIGPVFVIAGNARTSRAVLALLSLLLVAAVNA